MAPRISLQVLILLSAVGCWGPAGHLHVTDSGSDENEHWSPNVDTGGRDTDTDPVSGTHPEIRRPDAWCYTAEDLEWWGMSAQADDPQGVNTLETFVIDGILVQDPTGATVGSVALVCEESGQCWGSIQAEQIEVPCASASVHTFAFHVEDVDGHTSDEVTVRGRQASSAGG
ncbi:MAG: hypothetical protein ABIO70_21655 [Pseudomonadota bacterium]